jgi:predicted nuclease of predicted toxin-antitoxin system
LRTPRGSVSRLQIRWELGLDKSDDLVIWQRAKDSDFMLVSQDSDFAEMAAHAGSMFRFST